MSSLPGAYFYTNDIYADTAQCTDSTVGIWMLLLFIMVKRGTGTLVDTPKSLRMACRTTARNWNRAMEELTRYDIAEIEDVSDCDLIKIRSARMQRTIEEEEARYNSEKDLRGKRFKTRTQNEQEKSASTTVNERESAKNKDSVTASRALDLDKDISSVKEENGSPREARPPWAPSEKQAMEFFEQNSGMYYGGDRRAARKDGQTFWANYDAQDWVKGENQTPIRRWQSLAKKWMLEKDKFERKRATTQPVSSLSAFREVD